MMVVTLVIRRTFENDLRNTWKVAHLPLKASSAGRRVSAAFTRENGYDIRTVQELLGHKDVGTTMIYTHVLNQPGIGVKSPMDLVDRVEEREGVYDVRKKGVGVGSPLDRAES